MFEWHQQSPNFELLDLRNQLHNQSFYLFHWRIIMWEVFGQNHNILANQWCWLYLTFMSAWKSICHVSSKNATVKEPNEINTWNKKQNVLETCLCHGNAKTHCYLWSEVSRYPLKLDNKCANGAKKHPTLSSWISGTSCITNIFISFIEVPYCGKCLVKITTFWLTSDIDFFRHIYGHIFFKSILVWTLLSHKS